MSLLRAAAAHVEHPVLRTSAGGRCPGIEARRRVALGRRPLRPAGALLAALLAATAVAGISAVHSRAVALAQEPVRITLAITDVGYDCREGCDHVTLDDPWQPSVQVDLGALVELTLLWAHEGYIYDEHVMVLEGYDLEWDKIDSGHREASLQLIADQPGEFTLKCDTECEVHDYMQHAALRVGESAGGAAAVAKTQTELTITPSSRITAGEPVSLMVALKGADGEPVTKATVDFFTNGSLALVEGEMRLATAETDDNGVAFADYEPKMPDERRTITARFDGMGIYDATEATVEIQTVGSAVPAYRPSDVGLSGLRGAMPRVFGLAILGIWLILAFVVVQIIGIARGGTGT